VGIRSGNVTGADMDYWDEYKVKIKTTVPLEAQSLTLINCLDVPPPEVANSASLSQTPFYSFDLQQTLNAPLNTALPELNKKRF